MSFLTLFLNLSLLYSAWIPAIIALFKKKINFLTASILIMITQIIFSLLTIKDYSIFADFSFIDLLIGLLVGIIVFSLEYLIAILTNKKDKNKMTFKLKIKLTYLIVILIIPFVEEIYFRAFTYEWLANKNIEGINIGFVFILLSSIVVVINHFQSFKDKTVLIQKFFIEGMLLSCLFIITKNIWVIIIAHIVFNIINVFAYYEIRGLGYEKNSHSKLNNESKG